jgi:hypothetical protein
MNQLAAQTKRSPHHELVVWMAEERIAVKELASRIGCSANHLSDIRAGAYNPGVRLAVAIQRETGGRVRVEDWGAK